jgi:dsDNA-specific endonuclease/ATPase MutS2
MKTMEEEIDLHGMTVDEAIPRVDKFLYDAYQAGLYRVWIVHGKGTGILRREVGRYLAKHPLVNAHMPAERNNGGNGVTMVDLIEW